ncbi:hypothetical protein ABZ345_47375 [Lentzea sp. NPDC005914]|uniref:hypothetical protein n=1 Tax=Lentzea sp. NPDC005914 TaxID=3154572 RepID=UPI0033D13A3A
MQPVGNGRVRAHDLLRSYAADLLQQIDDDRDVALARLFHYYLTAACRAVDAALPNRRSGWHIDEIETPRFADSEAAWRWLRDEQQNLAVILTSVDPVAEPIRSAAEQVLGLLAQHSGDLPAALTHFERAWRLTPAAGHALWLDQVDTLLAAGMPNKASVYLNNVLDLLHSARTADDRLIAQVEHLRAQCALLQSDFKRASEAAREAAIRFRRVGDRRAAVVAELTALRAAMSLARAWPDLPTAKLPAFAEKLALQLRGMGLAEESDHALLWAARLSVSFGDVAAAQRYVERTAAPRDGAPLDHVVFRWLVKAELAAERGEFDDALDCASSGLDRLLAAFDRYGATDLVRGAGLFGRELGDLAVRIALKRGDSPDPEDVLTWLERARAHLHRHQPAASPDPAVSAAVDDFIRLTRTVQQQRVNGPVEADAVLRHEIALQRVSHLGWWSTTCVGSDALVSVHELADALEDKAFVSFVGSGDTLAAVVVADRSEHLVPLGQLSEMTEQARKLHFDLAAMAPDQVPKPVGNVIAYSAQNRLASLDTQLIRPLLRIIGDRSLVVVPVGQLYGVPWGSLPSLRGHPVVIAPSATAWFRALNSAQDVRLVRVL